MTTPTEKQKAPAQKSDDRDPGNSAGLPQNPDPVEEASEESFPASDPPSFSGGNHIIGAPSGRESDSPSSDHPAVVDAEKKAREKSAKH